MATWETFGGLTPVLPRRFDDPIQVDGRHINTENRVARNFHWPGDFWVDFPKFPHISPRH